jgi:MarR family transcriptional regulator for hemolysin
MPRVKKHELGQTLMLTLQDFQHRLDSDLATRGFPGIRHRHRSVFMHLERHGASRSVDLAAAAGIRPQSMMKIVHELEDLGLVTRSSDPADSRAKLVAFTPAGDELIRVLTESTVAVWDEYAQVLGKRELQRTLNALGELLDSQDVGD